MEKRHIYLQKRLSDFPKILLLVNDDTLFWSAITAIKMCNK